MTSQPSGIITRPLASDDYDGWLPLWQGYLTFYKASISDNVTRNTWARLLDADEPMHGLLAINEADEAVGLVHYLTHRSTWTKGDYCYLQDLFVSEHGRGRGTGRRLIEKVYQEAEALRCSRVYWLTHETNQNAILLYDKVADRSGFIQYRKLLDQP
jgi:GNAT superfamily N-acetyltransferase